MSTTLNMRTDIRRGDILNLFFEEYAEEHLIQPTFVMDHPVEISPLTKKKPENPDYVERFEFFMNGWEMANAYSELNDPIDQRERFKSTGRTSSQGDEEANTTDEDFMRALRNRYATDRRYRFRYRPYVYAPYRFPSHPRRSSVPYNETVG